MLYKVLAEKPCNDSRQRRDNDLEQHGLGASTVAKLYKSFYDRAENFPAIQEENREEASEMKHDIIGKRINVGLGDPEEPRNDNMKARLHLSVYTDRNLQQKKGATHGYIYII